MMRKLMISSILFLVCFGTAHADFRIWEDKDGNQYDAEFVRELFDKVTLRTRDGKEIRLGIEDFSEKDQVYFRVMVPPEVRIGASHESKEKEKAFEPYPDFSYITTIERDVITIKKRSKRTFTSRLFLEVFIIAKEAEPDRDNYILMDVSKGDFLFAGNTADKFVFKTHPTEFETYIQKYTSDQKRGEEYLGYILILKDRQDNIIQIDTNIAGKWAKKRELIPKLRELWEHGRASKYCRHFNKDGDWVDVPRVKHFRRVE